MESERLELLRAIRDELGIIRTILERQEQRTLGFISELETVREARAKAAEMLATIDRKVIS